MTRKSLAKILTVSPEKCIGCRTCELVCSFSKTNEFNPKHSAVSVISYDEACISVPVMCLQCDEAYCVKVCPVGATTKDPETGAVIVDEKKCIGCKMCMSVCPLGNMSYNPKEKKMIKCNLCGGDPMCAKFCPAGAIQYKEATEANLGKKKKIAAKIKDLFGEEDE
jgi:Fe-S-cluster-containing hydrogenase component 2